MKIFIIYTAIVIVTIVLCVLANGYKRKIFKELNKKEHKLKFLYGISAFLVDIVNTYIYSIRYDNIKVKLSRIYIKRADETEAYLYIVSKAALSIMLFLIIEAAGYFKCTEAAFSKQDRVMYIERPEYGEGERKYNLVADYEDGYHENIDIILEERKYKEDEVMRIFSDSYKELVTRFLGKNSDLENITNNVNLVSEVGQGIAVDWEIDALNYIDYSGNIRWENINGQEKTEIKAILSYGGYSKSYSLPLILNNENQNKNRMALNELKTIIDGSPDYEKRIELPNFAGEQKVQFYEEKEKGFLLYIILAFIAAVIIYVAKEKETDKQLEKRRRQLETDYAAIVNKLTILQRSGLTLVSAWDKIILDYEKDESKRKRFAYEEMKYTRNRMKAGYSEAASYLEFGRRCGIRAYIKFANLLEQNLKKGTKGLGDVLNAEVEEALEERKALAKKKGDEAGTRLLFPMGIMLIISIIMIMVPALMTINI